MNEHPTSTELMQPKYDATTQEPARATEWSKHHVYTSQHNDKPVYTIDTPPPTVSGKLHIGHIFSYTHTDISARYKRMQGFEVFYPFGFDDNGLPTERFVEKMSGTSAYKLGRSEFIKLCIQTTHTVEQEFKDLWQKIGLSVDWHAAYSTISDSTRKISQESFIRLLQQNHVYRTTEPALYCATCRTSVAQAELDDAQQPSTFNTITFVHENGTPLSIATTRPELLGSCVALFYNPEDPRYQHLKDTQAIVPIFGYSVPIIADPLVAIDKGTGLVMCCTFGDTTDIAWFKKYKLPYRPSLQMDGKFGPATGILSGMTPAQARIKIIDELRNTGALTAQVPLVHNVNIHERCKKEIEFLMIPQWFLRILEQKQTYIDLADQINWNPSYMKARYVDWVSNIKWDWCLSRQRFYGIPFPVWHCMSCAAILPASLDALPVDPQETSYPGGACPECSSTDIHPDTDVMDTWNTSSLTPYICAQLYNPELTSVFENKPAILPMSMRPQAHDIIRTWAFYTIIKTWLHHKTIPWSDIVISGHVLSTAQQKISKSVGNNPTDPLQLLSTYPADAIRYWTASGGLGTDIAFSEDEIKVGSKLITKLWNAYRFVSQHIGTTTNTIKIDQLGIINQWMLDRASRTFERYTHALDSYESGNALIAINELFWHDFCDNYLEIIKDQLFKPEKYSDDAVAATQWTLSHVGLRILQMYAPYVPYVTDTIYQTLYQKTASYKSLHQTIFANVQAPITFEHSVTVANHLLSIVGTIRKFKSEHKLSLKVPIEHLELVISDAALRDQLKTLHTELAGVTHAVHITHTDQALTFNSYEQRDGLWYARIMVQ